MKKSLISALVVMGFSGIIAQILVLRELLITFYGNELSIGIILANWLILEAFGCFFLGRMVERLKIPLQGFVSLIIIFSLSFPLAIYFTRILKEIIGVTAGEGLGLIQMFYSSFFILLSVSISHGALFTFGCNIYSLYFKPDAISIGRVYIYETVGTIIGGITLNYLLIPYFHSFQAALGVALINLIIAIFLVNPFWRDSQQKTSPRILTIISLIFLLLSGFLIFTQGADKIHWLSIRNQWKNQDLLHYQNSIYGNVVVTKRGEQYTFFSDGIPIITAPTPDIAFVEEFVHLPMLAHPNPEKVLILSGGAGGVISEPLKHPSVERIDYVELNPLILKTVKSFPTNLTEFELNNPKVTTEHIDGRMFLKKSSDKYDLILLGLSNPSDLQVNRFFTKELFALAKERLKEEGILVVNLTGSLTYLSEELKNLNACIVNTLKSVFPYLKIIPGDSVNFFLASASKDISLVNHEQLSQRLKEREIQINLLTTAHIEYKLHSRWLNWFLKSLEGGTEKINQDFRPLGVFFSLSYWNAQFSPYMKVLFRWFERVNLLLFLFILILVITLVSLIIIAGKKGFFSTSIPFCITTTGFAGMIFDLALIFTFQALYGYAFHWIGLLVTAFMAGTALGAIAMISFLSRIKEEFAVLIKTELAIILFSAILPLTFMSFHPYLHHPIIFFLLKVVFLVLSFLSGFLIGVQFPLANKIYLDESLNLSRTAGLLYSADLLGGWVSGIFGGIVLLPVLGLFGACMLVVILKISSLIVVTVSEGRIIKV